MYMSLTRLDRAIIFATDALSGIFDKVGQPTIFHSLSVMMSVGLTESLQVVAVLHDIAEDTYYTIVDIEKEIPLTAEEKEALELLTHRNQPYKEYIQKIKDSNNSIAQKVKLADVKHNMSRPTDNLLSTQTQERLKKKVCDSTGNIKW